MSLYADYLTERTDDKILEREFGFVTYRHMPEQLQTYIIDIYIKPDLRGSLFGTSLADEVVKEARSLGHTKIIGSVVPTSKNSTESLKALLAYGMRLQSSGQNYIIMEKDI